MQKNVLKFRSVLIILSFSIILRIVFKMNMERMCVVVFQHKYTSGYSVRWHPSLLPHNTSIQVVILLDDIPASCHGSPSPFPRQYKCKAAKRGKKNEGKNKHFSGILLKNMTTSWDSDCFSSLSNSFFTNREVRTSFEGILHEWYFAF